jgi:lipopolysaccharide export system protein LptC
MQTQQTRAIATQALLVILAAGTWWLAERWLDKDVGEPKTDSSQIDYYAKKIQRTVLTPEGQPKEMLFAERMTHYKDDNHTEMEKPVMTLYTSSSEPWIIHSERATAQADGKAVLMQGQVLVTHKDKEGEEMKILTSNVKYLPETDYAETADAVQMLATGDSTEAVGAQVYFEPVLKINLLAHVRRKHEMR